MSSVIKTASVAVVAGAVFAFSPAAQAADPTTADCLAANNSAIDLRNDHKLRAARGQLLICASASCPADIRKECLRRVDEVNTHIPTIIFEAKEASGKDLSAVKVSMDGQPLAERLEGSALSIDPGEHTFTFEAAGQAPLTKQFVIREGEKDRRERISFGGAEAPRAPAATPPLPAPTPPPLYGSPEAESGSRLGTQKILAIVAGGVGVVGVALGSIFGIMALSKKNDAQNVCPDQCLTADGVSKWSDAKSAGNVSTVAFVVGGLGLAGGAVLWFTAKPESGMQVGVGPGAIQWKGTW